MSFVDNLMAVLTFNKEKMGKLADDGAATMQGIVVLIISAIVSVLPYLLTYLDSGSTATEKNSALTLVITDLLTLILVVFLVAGIMAFVLRGLGANATMAQTFRVFSFAEVWEAIAGILVVLTKVDSLSLVGLLSLVSLIIGVMAYSGAGVGKAIVAVIITYILAIIIVFIIVLILLLVFFTALINSLASTTFILLV